MQLNGPCRSQGFSKYCRSTSADPLQCNNIWTFAGLILPTLSTKYSKKIQNSDICILLFQTDSKPSGENYNRGVRSSVWRKWVSHRPPFLGRSQEYDVWLLCSFHINAKGSYLEIAQNSRSPVTKTCRRLVNPKR